MKYKLFKDNYPFDGRSFALDERLQNLNELTLSEQADVVKVAYDYNHNHGAIVQLFIESFSHLWDKDEYSNMLVQLAQAWFIGDCRYRRLKFDDQTSMVAQQRKAIIEYYSPNELLDSRLKQLQIYIDHPFVGIKE